jgi:hypothetical protein
MSLAHILESYTGGAEQSAVTAVTIPMEVLHNLKKDIDQIYETFMASNSNFKHVQSENVEAKDKVVQLEAKLAKAYNDIAKQNARLLEQQHEIAALNLQLMARKAKRAAPEGFPAAKACKKPRADAADAGETKQRCKHTASPMHVYNTFRSIKPIFVVSGWQFADKDAASEFWTAVSKMPVYRNLTEEVGLNSAKKTINALDYDRVSQDADEKSNWRSAVSWRWDYVRAMINCYWLRTTTVLDGDVKAVIKKLEQQWHLLDGADNTESDAPDFPARDLEAMTPFISHLFPFSARHVMIRLSRYE